MDSLTHLVTGAALGEVLAGKRLGKGGLLIGALASSLPDVDVAANLFSDPVTAAWLHRGITHSVFFAFAASFFLAKIFKRALHASEISFHRWFYLFLSCILLHDFLDLLTSYGTGLLEPFSGARFSLNLFFVADPFFTFPFLAVFILLLAWKHHHPKRIYAIKMATMIGGAYFLFALINKWHVSNIFKKTLAEHQLRYHNFMTTPAPLNNFLWYCIAENPVENYTGYYSIFDKQKKMELDTVPKNDPVRVLFSDDKKLNLLIRFSNGYYCFTKNGKNVYINDLRFGRVAGWMKKDSRFVFSYNIRHNQDQTEILKRTDFDVSMKDAFKGLVRRSRGVE